MTIGNSEAYIIDKQVKTENYNWFDYKETDLKTIRIDGVWENDFSKLVDKTIEGLIVWSLEQELDLTFISQLKFLKSISIHALKIKNFDAIRNLPHLEKLDISTIVNQDLNFDSLDSLKILCVNWKRKYQLNTLSKDLEMLIIEKGINLDWLNLLTNKALLMNVQLIDCDINQADILFKLPKLKYLSLTGCRQINFDVQSKNKSIKFIDLRQVPLKNLEWVRQLEFVEIVHISNAGDISDIEPLRNRQSIIGLTITSKTNIIHGDLSVLETLINLKNCYIAGKRHYSHKTIENWNWNNFELPTKTLIKRLEKQKK